MIVLSLIILLVLPIVAWPIYKHVRKGLIVENKIIEFLIIALFIISSAVFCFGWAFNSDDYHKAIDIVDGGYTPFSSKHVLTLIVCFALSMLGLIMLWLKGRSLPPLLFVCYLIFLLIGIPISIAILIQISHNLERSDAGFFFMFLPITYILVSLSLAIKLIITSSAYASNKVYKNIYLNYLNQKMAKSGNQSIWVLILMMPVLLIIVAILMLFGQDADSIAKVFTETTTWTFSQKTHPPFLDHKGHYLCTVAACGHPQIVKPIRLGKRHGYEIIVNRQLLIANAFEDLIQVHAPALHQMIRHLYDKYGYPLSKNITSTKGSNLVYVLMKPLEYFFLIVLYLCCIKPEEQIAKQYSI